jgi:sulfatase maturation enzyme AslB (radical SAM superfamily)
MFCPRLDHFTRLRQNGSVGKCGHMINEKSFASFEEMENSDWLRGLRQTMADGHWPEECYRCEQSEKTKGQSIRTNSIDRHNQLHPILKDYLIVGGVLDNVCNSACQSCTAGFSTKIGSLESRDYVRVDNTSVFATMPRDRIVELDVSGGEPTASKNYKKLIKDLPSNVRIVRMNTNGSRIIPEIEELLKKNIKVIITMSLDGIGAVHDYTRWPILWKDYVKTLDQYLDLKRQYKLLQLDFWTTVSCLNVGTLPDIIKFAEEKGIPHDYAFLHRPDVLNIKYKNVFTIPAKQISPTQVAVDRDNQSELETFLRRQDSLRKINVGDYLNFGPK